MPVAFSNLGAAGLAPDSPKSERHIAGGQLDSLLLAARQTSASVRRGWQSKRRMVGVMPWL